MQAQKRLGSLSIDNHFLKTRTNAFQKNLTLKEKKKTPNHLKEIKQKTQSHTFS